MKELSIIDKAIEEMYRLTMENIGKIFILTGARRTLKSTLPLNEQ
jgi:hypothetical protein